MPIPRGIPSIDWLTVTNADAWPEDENCLNSLKILEYLWSVLSEGEMVEPEAKSVMQYKGWNHEKVFVGQCDQGSMLQIRSWAADALFNECDQADNCTRIDLAVTFQMDGTGSEGNKLGKIMYDHIYGAGKSGADYWVAPRLRLDEVKGDVLEVGARSSERYLRVYNKTLEGKDERYEGGEWWRAELELKGGLARKAYALLADPHGRGGRILGLVAGELQRRGSLVPFDQARAIPASVSHGSTNTTNESRVKWLKEQVAPTIAKLRAAGYWSHDLATMLGLDVD